MTDVAVKTTQLCIWKQLNSKTHANHHLSVFPVRPSPPAYQHLVLYRPDAIPWQYHHFHWLSMTFAIFHDFPCLENGLPKFHDFPRPGGTLFFTGRCHSCRATNSVKKFPGLSTVQEICSYISAWYVQCSQRSNRQHSLNWCVLLQYHQAVTAFHVLPPILGMHR